MSYIGFDDYAPAVNGEPESEMFFSEGFPFWVKDEPNESGLAKSFSREDIHSMYEAKLDDFTSALVGELFDGRFFFIKYYSSYEEVFYESLVSKDFERLVNSLPEDKRKAIGF